MAGSESKRVRLRWVAAGVIGAMLAGLGMVWAEHVPIPEGLDEEEREFYERLNNRPDASGHTESGVG